MAYNLELAKQITGQLKGLPFIEKKMFGGVGYLIHGNTPALASGANVTCGVHKNFMIVRVDPEKHSKLLKKSHTKVFDITGKPMKGWRLVKPEGLKTNKQLSGWVNEGADFALTLPPK